MNIPGATAKGEMILWSRDIQHGFVIDWCPHCGAKVATVKVTFRIPDPLDLLSNYDQYTIQKAFGITEPCQHKVAISTKRLRVRLTKKHVLCVNHLILKDASGVEFPIRIQFEDLIEEGKVTAARQVQHKGEDDGA